MFCVNKFCCVNLEPAFFGNRIVQPISFCTRARSYFGPPCRLVIYITYFWSYILIYIAKVDKIVDYELIVQIVCKKELIGEQSYCVYCDVTTRRHHTSGSHDSLQLVKNEGCRFFTRPPEISHCFIRQRWEHNLSSQRACQLARSLTDISWSCTSFYCSSART